MSLSEGQLIQLRQQAIDRAAAIVRMADNGDWEFFEEMVRATIEECKDELTLIDPANAVTIARTQGRLTAFGEILGLQASMRELLKMADEDGAQE